MASSLEEASAGNQGDLEAHTRKMFSQGYLFPMQDTDDSLKIEINDLVSFGDIKDASTVKPQNVEISGTILGHVCTVRSFHPGNYKVTVIQTHIDENVNDPLVIFHHEDINPNLLARQVVCLDEDYDAFHRGLLNSVNRYDWCRWTHFESYDGDNDENEPKSDFNKSIDLLVSFLGQDFQDDVASTVPIPDVFPAELFRTHVFFTKTENAKDMASYILKNQVRRSSVIKQLFSVQDDDGKTVSIGINSTPFFTSEWEYGKTFQNSETGSYFALILHGYVTLHEGPWKDLYTAEEKKEIGFTTIKETGLKFPMSQFLFKEN